MTERCILKLAFEAGLGVKIQRASRIGHWAADGGHGLHAYLNAQDHRNRNTTIPRGLGFAI